MLGTPAAPGAGPPLRTPAFQFEFSVAGRKYAFQLFWERPWVTWLNQIQAQVNTFDEALIQPTTSAGAVDVELSGEIARAAISAAPHAESDLPLADTRQAGREDDLLVADRPTTQDLVELVSERVLLLIQQQVRDAITEEHLLLAPPLQRKMLQGYTVTNVTTDRTFDADATTVDEIADVLGTLLRDLKTGGI